MSVVTTRGILLRAHAYGDTSRILRFLTPDLGLVGLVAKGVRRQSSRGRSTLDTFSEGSLTLYHRQGRELQTFKDFHVTRSRRGLASSMVHFSGASVIGEIVLRHAGEEANPLLYEALDRGLNHIEEAAADRAPAVILTQGWRLVSVLGYRPELDHCVACGKELRGVGMSRFDFSAGGVRCDDCASGDTGPRVGPGAREQLSRMVEGTTPDVLPLPRTHLRILGDFVTYHLSASRPLQSVPILESMLPREDGDGAGRASATDSGPPEA